MLRDTIEEGKYRILNLLREYTTFIYKMHEILRCLIAIEKLTNAINGFIIYGVFVYVVEVNIHSNNLGTIRCFIMHSHNNEIS